MIYRFSGPGGKAVPSDAAREGIGHAYIRSRLRESFGDSAGFESGSDEQGGWTSIITIPAS